MSHVLSNFELLLVRVEEERAK